MAAGKSTISGNIMYVTGQVDKRTIEKFEREVVPPPPLYTHTHARTHIYTSYVHIRTHAHTHATTNTQYAQRHTHHA